MPSRYGAVLEASVALLRGQVLRGSEAERSGNDAWGIVDCSLALGAFDARSEAWCGSDGIPHRYTREEAEARARRLTGSQHEGEGYAALEIPTKPRLVMAGRHCAAGLDALLFECVDWTNGPAVIVVVGSAFDAADAFVALMGERLAYTAVYGTEAE